MRDASAIGAVFGELGWILVFTLGDVELAGSWITPC